MNLCSLFLECCKKTVKGSQCSPIYFFCSPSSQVVLWSVSCVSLLFWYVISAPRLVSSSQLFVCHPPMIFFFLPNKGSTIGDGSCIVRGFSVSLWTIGRFPKAVGAHNKTILQYLVCCFSYTATVKAREASRLGN